MKAPTTAVVMMVTAVITIILSAATSVAIASYTAGKVTQQVLSNTNQVIYLDGRDKEKMELIIEIATNTELHKHKLEWLKEMIQNMKH